MKKIFTYLILIALIVIISIPLFIKKEENTKYTTIKVAEVTHSIFYSPFYAAIENGYFKEEGLDIDLILTSGADKVAASVLSNDVSIGLAGLESTIYVYNGGEEDYLVNFSGLTKRDGQFIIARSDEDFSLENLYNKEILVGRLGGMPMLNFMNALKNMGIDTTKININTSVDFASLSGTFIGGVGDYVNLFEPTATKIEKEEYGYVVASIGEYSGEMPYTTFYSKKSYYDTNKDIIDKFKNAINKGLQYIKDNDEITIANAIKNEFPDEDINSLAIMIKRYKDYDCYLDNTNISEYSFNNLNEVLLDNNLIEEYAPYSLLVHND